MAARPSDFAGFPAGNIALIQRGTCFFRDKVDNAAAAGASAVIVFNQGNVVPDDDRFGLFFGTLDPPVAAIPAVSTTFAIGEALANTAGLQMRVAVDATIKTTTTFNVLADTPGGRADRTVVVGAHLDSVPEGPGINDNGSGSAAILETALQMAELGIAPTNRVRFAFWGGEEDGLIGSDYYVVAAQRPGQLKEHAVNLNFDMVGSPNFVRFVYDGDGSAFGATGPNGSAAWSRCSSTTSPRRVWPPSRPSSTVAPTTSPSSTTASPPVACSPAPRASRPPSEAADLRRHRRRRLRPVLPPGLRQHRQPERYGARPDVRRHRPHHADVRHDDVGGQRHRQGRRRKHHRLRAEGQPRHQVTCGT